MTADTVQEAADSTAELDATLQECVAQGTISSTRARYPVNGPMVDIWADAHGDLNPVYRDDAAAAATGRPGVIAPPTMIQAWTMPPLPALAATLPQVRGYAPYVADRAAAPPAGADAPVNPAAAVHRLLTAHGYTARAATHCRQEYHREAVVGDHLVCETVLSKVSPRKQTALGAGYFVTTRMTFRDHVDQDVATVDWTVLCFRTPTAPTASAGKGSAPAASPAPEPAAPEPGGLRTCAPRTEPVRVGDRTATTTIPITPTFVIATAFATQDFYAAHHDADWTRTSLGRPGIFTNILSTTALVGGVATDWGGPATRLLDVDLRLLAPNHSGDTLTLQGEVTAVDGDRVTLSVTGTNALGPHVLATVTAEIPAA